MKHLPLRVHLTRAFTIIALIPILILGSIQIFQINQIKDDYKRTQMHTTQRLADAVEAYIYYRKNAIETLGATISASRTSFRDRAGITPKLQSLQASLPGLINVVAADRSGIITASFPETNPTGEPLVGTSLSQNSYYSEMLKAQSTTISSLFRGLQSAGTPGVVIATPIFSEDRQYDGFVAAALDLKQLEQLVTKYDYGKNTYPVVLDRLNQAIYHPDQQVMATMKNLSTEAVVQAAEESPEGLGRFMSSLLQQEELITYTTISGLGWKVWVGRSYQTVNEALFNSLLLTFTLLLLAIGLTIALGFFLAKRLNNTIHLLVGYTQKLADGSYKERPEKTAMRGVPYELNVLANRFFEMAQQVNENQKALLGLNAELEHRVEDRTQSLSRKNKELEIVNTLITPMNPSQETPELIEGSIDQLRLLLNADVRLDPSYEGDTRQLGIFSRKRIVADGGAQIRAAIDSPAYIVPVRSGTIELAHLNVSQGKENGNVSEQDRNFLHTFANSVAVMLQNDLLLKSVQHEHATLQAVLESMTDAIVLIDMQKQVVYGNRQMSEMFGIPIPELLQMSEEAMFETVRLRSPESREVFTSLISQEVPAVKFKLTATTGKERFMIVTSFLVLSQDHVYGRGYVWRDITKEHEVDSLKNDLISLASHEFKTPITGIKGSVETLLRVDADWDESFKQELLEGIHEDIGRIQQLIEDWLDISKIEAGAMRVNREPTRIQSIIRNAIKRLPSADEHWMEMDASLEGSLPLIYADKDRLEQVFVNLFTNAIRYNDRQPFVRVTAESDNSYVYIRVIDNGTGIHADHLEHIFDRFYRVDLSSSRRTSGTGLGLAICKGIMDSHGGQLHVESTEGEGSTFIVSIPQYNPKVDDVV
ncbi:PAS domain S-box-containing protein [Paenibacillus sp. 1_12]|uniref:sensor histidine kinase n=1 Tax=Paenibacillus sp. 1_12 TaxID=1566278 RepID=UPI0008ED7926|nr:ATP-binding protein [Paenibacillus sp. 1_12]SFM17936.1 PAS domain S-box-containing protein [Paenibacillus sp. 1_12]